MYVAGIITGFMFTSFLWLVIMGILLLRFDDVLWRERSRAVIRDRARQVTIEDHRGRRRDAGCVKTIDMLDEAI